jgi:hypothetical protein
MQDTVIAEVQQQQLQGNCSSKSSSTAEAKAAAGYKPHLVEQ